LELLGKLEEAVQDCNRALSLDANYLKVLDAATCSFFKAISLLFLFWQASSSIPHFNQAYLRRARAYTRMERYEEAVRDYEQAKKLDPENAGTHPPPQPPPPALFLKRLPQTFGTDCGRQSWSSRSRKGRTTTSSWVFPRTRTMTKSRRPTASSLSNGTQVWPCAHISLSLSLCLWRKPVLSS
jgi:tetratricopeptide (TPR) repeat protein